jgi:hypothetical protein
MESMLVCFSNLLQCDAYAIVVHFGATSQKKLADSLHIHWKDLSPNGRSVNQIMMVSSAQWSYCCLSKSTLNALPGKATMLDESAGGKLASM